MSTQKADDFIAYKFNEYHVYASTEWLADGKKKYKSVFEASLTGYIYNEFSFYNKLFDEKDWTVKVNLVCHELNPNLTKGKEVCNINVDRDVKSSENIVYIREGWGNVKPGVFWKKGAYLWEASLDGKIVGTKKFYVEDAGEVNDTQNPYLSVKGISMFEGSSKMPPQKDRVYYTDFAAKESRYIWGELKINNALQDRDWYCEMVFNFYNDARQLKGRTTELTKIRKGQKTITISSGWGSDKKGTWHHDKYTLEIVFMDQLLGIIPFGVGESNQEGLSQPILPSSGQPLVIIEPLAEKTLNDLMADLDEMIGLDSIKEQIREYTQYLNFLKLREEKGFKDPQKLNLHAVFTGNPGTGKTTVAKKLGKIYHKMGLLSKGHVNEVDRADIVGEYIGQTAPKVKEAIKKARGGILFIDEAYALARPGDDNKDYGKEVIEIVLKEMSDGPGDLAILVAGYPKEMSHFLDSNPGLKSRFNMFYDFPDYLPQELMDISAYSAKDRNVNLTEAAKKFMYEKLVEAYRTRDRSFGNARYVNSLIGEGKMNMGLRVMKATDPSKLTNKELSTIELEDLERIFGISKRRTADIPLDDHLYAEAMAELNQMVGLEKVKQEIHELARLVKFYRETGKDVLNSFSLHSVFTGNPGTGKTTLARIVAKIFKALGILEKGHIVEVDRQSLVGGFIGQTAIKTSAKIDEAIGGVLFIDEAYALNSSDSPKDFGKEAVETILKRMEDQRGQFIVVAAGYPHNMEQFLESNPGLKSRFDKVFEFEDYSPDQLYEICEMMLLPENLKPEPTAEKHLKDYFTFIHGFKDKFFGNARTVRKVVEESVRRQHLRLAAMNAKDRTPEMLKTLTYDDVDEFKLDRDALINKGQGNIGFKFGESAPTSN